MRALCIKCFDKDALVCVELKDKPGFYCTDCEEAFTVTQWNETAIVFEQKLTSRRMS